jgi:HK97 family phage major capsid protein
MDVREKLRKALLEARAICDAAEKEGRDFTGEERQQVETLLKEAKALKDQLKAAEGDAALRQAILDMGAGIELNEKQKSDGRGVPAGKGQTLGERFIASPEWQAWYKQVAPNGHIPESRKGLSSPPVEMKSFGLFRRKELIAGADATGAGAFIVPDDTGIYEPIGRYPVTLRDLIAVRTTTSDTVEFVRQTKQVTEAAPTPEANVKYPTGATGEIDGTKPQGEMRFERVTEVVKTIAVYVGATKRALSDVGQLRGLIDQELREDLVDELENQLFNGNGVGENFTGLANQAGTLIQAFNTNGIITARQAITTLLVVGRQRPTAFVFHPTDWEAIDLLRDLNGQFLRGSPFGGGPNTLWGVPVVQSFHIAQGSAWLANWRKMVLWDREQATISMTDSHDDWFIRNLIAILAEMRAAMGLIRPSAFVNVLLA